ncbi:hypothetical protein MRX96_046548 [Rhipicephalus microplus]
MEKYRVAPSSPTLDLSSHHKMVAWNDLPNVLPQSLSQNRLMHSQSMYELRDYATGGSVAGAPAPGEAPTELFRGCDEWADNSFDFGSKMKPYPSFSTIWSGWMDSVTCHILALQQEGKWSRWQRLLANGVNSEASGVWFASGRIP